MPRQASCVVHQERRHHERRHYERGGHAWKDLISVAEVVSGSAAAASGSLQGLKRPVLDAPAAAGRAHRPHDNFFSLSSKSVTRLRRAVFPSGFVSE